MQIRSVNLPKIGKNTFDMSKKQNFYGCLVRVSDINRVRSFYRDTLELGDPIIDSNFWLEFHLPGTGNGKAKKK